LSVNDDMPSSYFLAAMPGRMPSNALFWNSTSSPSFWPTAFPRSTSIPMIVVPSVSTNSLGAYDASEPTTILPSDATSDGTSLASASSFCTAGAGLVLAPPAGCALLPPPPLPSPPAPQPATATASSATASVRILIHMSVALDQVIGDCMLPLGSPQ
jgi:hypothetical protein